MFDAGGGVGCGGGGGGSGGGAGEMGVGRKASVLLWVLMGPLCAQEHSLLAFSSLRIMRN